MADRPDLVDEEKRMFASPEGPFPANVSQALKDVRERMALDFFGMDFGIAADGRVVLFEANATMNFFPFLSDPQFAYVQSCLPSARQAFREMVGLPPRASAGLAARDGFGTRLMTLVPSCPQSDATGAASDSRRGPSRPIASISNSARRPSSCPARLSPGCRG